VGASKLIILVCRTKGGEDMVEIELNNGEIVKSRPKDAANYHDRYEGYREILLRILDEASDKIGYIPSFEEAKNNPWMPQDLDLYNKHCGSYVTAVRTVSKRRSARQKWRKATQDELRELELREKKCPIDSFKLPPGRPTGDRKVKAFRKKMKNAEKIEKKGEEKMGKTGAEIRKERYDRLTEECVEALRNFALENLRWPTDAEIKQRNKDRVPGWPSKAALRDRFGMKVEWGEKVFPEGLPEGFVEANTAHIEKSEVQVMVKDDTAMIRKIFLDTAGKISEVVGGASKAKIDLTMSVQIEENEPIKLNFSDTH